MNRIKQLPDDIIRLIYQYDSTYRTIFNKVLKEMIYYSHEYTLKNQNLINTITLKEKHKNNPLFCFKYYRIHSYNPYYCGTMKFQLVSCERLWEGNHRQVHMLKMPTILKYFCIDYEFQYFNDEEEEHFYDEEEEEDDDEEEEDDDEEED